MTLFWDPIKSVHNASKESKLASAEPDFQEPFLLNKFPWFWGSGSLERSSTGGQTQWPMSMLHETRYCSDKSVDRAPVAVQGLVPRACRGKQTLSEM